MEIKKWYTLSEYVDQATGEALTRKNAENNYIIIKRIRHVKINEEINHGRIEGIGLTTITNICSRAGKQLEIQWKNNGQ